MLRKLFTIGLLCFSTYSAAGILTTANVLGSRCSGFSTVEKTGPNTYALFMYLDDAGATAYGRDQSGKNCVINWNFQMFPGEKFDYLTLTAAGAANFDGPGVVNTRFSQLTGQARIATTSNNYLKSEDYPGGVAQWKATGVVHSSQLDASDRRCGANISMKSQIYMRSVGKSFESYTDVWADKVLGNVGRAVKVCEIIVRPCF